MKELSFRALSGVLMSATGLIALVFLSPSAQAGEWSGYASAEVYGFPSDALFPEQYQGNFSVSIQPEYYHDWSGGRQSVLAVAFARWDFADPERTHFDIREMIWQLHGDGWGLRAGIGKVFWGVTESQHLVDIVNQTDFVENIDGEDKLGQSMVDLSLIRSWGTWDFFVLPFFRERTYPGPSGRPRFPLRVATELTEYTSSAKDRHVDLAVRWSHIIGDFDLGASYFYGTSRDPLLLVGIDDSGDPVLIPRYDIIHQTGLDVQATKGSWLWKLELISRSGQEDRFQALTGGFEYTFFNLRDSNLDLGLLAEYLYDSRGKTINSPFDDDVFLAARLALNDTHSTEVLGGITFDRKDGSSFINIEASRRLGDRWKLYLEVRIFAGIPEGDPFYGYRNDDYVLTELAWYF